MPNFSILQAANYNVAIGGGGKQGGAQTVKPTRKSE